MKRILIAVVTVITLFTLVGCKTTKFDDHYIVVFYLGSEARMESVQVEKGGTIARPKDPESDNASFEEWYSDIKYTKVFDFNEPINQSITIYGKWSYLEYEIIYDLDSEAVNSPSNPTLYKYSMGNVTLRQATKEGYLFDGWYLTPELSRDSKIIEINKNNVVDGMILYPKWRKLN